MDAAGTQKDPIQKDDGAADDLQEQFRKLALAMEARQRQIQEREEQLHQAQEALATQASTMEGLLGHRSDVIHLNVGGTHMSTTRRTLTLVPGSLLATMFSGAWDDRLARDEAGRIFLDYDPALFSLLLNWLRTQDLGPPDAPLCEVALQASQVEPLLVLLDFLQLHRHLPLRYDETFHAGRSSPHVSVGSSTVFRTQRGGYGEYAVAATSHTMYDMHVELLLEVLHFGAVPRQASGQPADTSTSSSTEALPNHPMMVGVILRQQLESVDQSKKRANVCWQSSCYGWWTSRKHASVIAGGKNRQIGDRVLWAEGDTLLLALDCRKHLPTARLSLVNTRNNASQSLDIDTAALAGIEEQWLFIVGIAGRADEVRANSARRRGEKPGASAAAAGAVAQAAASGSS